MGKLDEIGDVLGREGGREVGGGSEEGKRQVM